MEEASTGEQDPEIKMYVYDMWCIIRKNSKNLMLVAAALSQSSAYQVYILTNSKLQ